MRDFLLTVLKPLSNMFYNWTAAVPMGAVKLIFVGMLVLMMVWVWRLRSERVEADGVWTRVCNDLRFWALSILSVQVVIYILLG